MRKRMLAVVVSDGFGTTWQPDRAMAEHNIDGISFTASLHVGIGRSRMTLRRAPGGARYMAPAVTMHWLAICQDNSYAALAWGPRLSCIVARLSPIVA
ncbi:hypothetical protein GCM10007386_27130 [Pseudoduganella dura]|nr:hypothetical protein GCM10007386_27130 [Pseudoduganella dura]